MAKYNEILVGRFNRALQKLLSMKGNAPAPQLSTEMMAVLAEEFGIENRYLLGWSRFGVSGLVNAVAAQNSAVRIRNPAGSNFIGVLERLWANEAATDAFNVEGPRAVAAALAVGVFGPSVLDPRQGAGLGLLEFSAGNNVAAVSPFLYQPQVLANTPFDFIEGGQRELVLLPGQGITISTNAVNVQLRAGVIWRERFLEDSERT